MKPDEVVELLLCPFCKREPQQQMRHADGDMMKQPYLGVRCEEHTQWLTVEQWNRRALLGQPKAASWKPEDDQTMPSAAPASGEMPEEPERIKLSLDEIIHAGMWVTAESYDRLRAYALSLREKREGK